MEFWSILMQILLLLVGAFLMGVIAERLRQSAIVGYLLAGLIIGPWVFNQDIVFQLAELGVALLLFSIGLEFSFQHLKRLGTIAFGGGTLQVTITMLVFTAGVYIFRPMAESLAIGSIVALSSTAVVMRVLVDRAELDSTRGRNALGILLLQDISIVPLVILVSMIGHDSSGPSIFFSIIRTGGGAIGLVALFYILFNYMVPFLLKTKTMHASRDLMILFAILIAIGSTWIAHAVGLSPALGAFLAGMMLAECDYSVQIRSDIGSLRTIFVTLFFTSIGMLANPQWMFYHIHWVVAGLLIMVIGKTLIIYTIVRFFGYSTLQSLATGITLAQIGEFSFVLAITARNIGLINENIFNWIVSVTIMSIFISPYMVAHASKIAHQLVDMFSSRKSKKFLTDNKIETNSTQQIIIIGFGPAGQQVADGLLANGIRPSVIEMRPASANHAKSRGLVVYMGDASHDEVLIHAGMKNTCLVVVTIPDPRMVRNIVENIRKISSDSTVIARSRYHIYNREIEKAGAHMIIDEENMVGKDLAQAVMDCLKGTGDLDISCACALAGLPSETDHQNLT